MSGVGGIRQLGFPEDPSPYPPLRSEGVSSACSDRSSIRVEQHAMHQASGRSQPLWHAIGAMMTKVTWRSGVRARSSVPGVERTRSLPEQVDPAARVDQVAVVARVAA